MENKYSDQSHQCTLYPGDYFPKLGEQELTRVLQQARKVNTVAPAVSMSEQDLYFKVEAALPGLHREDFFISIDEDVLSIAVLHEQSAVTDDHCFRMNELNYDCYNRKLTLPKNAESSFVKAEYKEGVLNMYLPKTDFPARYAHTQVIVY